jgi:hypothetical protein
MLRGGFFCALAVTVGACLVASLGRAQAQQPVDEATRSAARDLGYEGVELFQKGDFAGADDRLDRAYRALKAPSLGLWSARALAKLGKLVEANERYLEVTRLDTAGQPEIQRTAQADAAHEQEALQSRIPRIVVKVAAPQGSPAPEVTVDGAAIPSSLIGVKRPVNPGKHVIVAKSGALSSQKEINVAEGSTTDVPMVLEAGGAPVAPATQPVAPAPAPALAPENAPSTKPTGDASADEGTAAGSGQRTAAWVAIGVGAAGLVVGGVTGVMAISTKSSVEDQCRNNQCLPPAHADVDKYNSLRTISSVGFIAGVVCAGAGVTLLLTAPKPESTALQLRAYVGASEAGVAGSF